MKKQIFSLGIFKEALRQMAPYAILLTVFYGIISIINMILDKHHWKTEIKYQLPLFIIGVLLVSVGFGVVLDFILASIGWILAIISLLYQVNVIIRLAKAKRR